MAEITLVIDPDGTSFALHDRANGRWVTGFSAPVPETASQWASSVDTEGERRAVLKYANRTITASVFLQKSTAALLDALEADLGEKIGKLTRDGGVVKFGYPSGATIAFTVEEASMQRVFDPAHLVMNLAQYEVSFVCRPLGYGNEQDLGDNTETTLPVLVFSETIPGSVEALGRCVIDDDSANDQYFMVWGVEDDSEYTHTSSSGSGALFYQAESRTALGGAAATAVASASGGTVVRQGTLTPTYQAMLSTQASGGGAHLSHVGEFNVWARIQMPTTNTGEVSVAFEYAQGDFRKKTTVGEVTFDANHGREGQWIFQRLGQVNIQSVATGTHRWEGRVIAKSTATGDDLDLDYLAFFPTRGYGEAKGVDQFVTPTSFLARDDFTATTAGGTLNTRVAPVGGTWATSGGGATDFSFVDSIVVSGATLSSSEAISRTETNGARYAILGGTNYTNVEVRTDYVLGGSGTLPEAGVIARWTDSSNYLVGRIKGNGRLQIATFISGSETVLAFDDSVATASGVASFGSAMRTLVLRAYANGLVVLGLLDNAGHEIARVGASSTDLATGGTLATGKPGIYDIASAGTRTASYDNFAVSTPVSDAAIFASQSLELRHDSVLREDSTGTYWNRVSSVVGDYLRLPVAGQEGRSTRMIVKLCRNDPDTMVDSAIDDLSARLNVTPRYLSMPG